MLHNDVHMGSFFKFFRRLLALRPEGGARDTRHAACGYLCAVGRQIVKILRAKASGVTYHTRSQEKLQLSP